MKIKVEKGIPIPPRGKSRVNKIRKYDFLDDLEVGDSFVITGKNEVPRTFQAMKARNMRMTQRIIEDYDDPKKNKWRIWYTGPVKKEESTPTSIPPSLSVYQITEGK